MTSLLFFVSVKESFIFPAIRQNLIRIPEVLLRLKEAETLLNQFNDNQTIDMIKLMQSQWLATGKTHNQSIKHLQIDTIAQSAELLNFQHKLQLIASYVSQVGLFDRYIKLNSYPEFILYNTQCCQAALASVKKYPIKKMIKNILQNKWQTETNKDLDTYVVLKRKNGQYIQQQKISHSDFKFQFEAFALTANLKAFVHLGPGQSMQIAFSKLSAAQFTELETISTDPLLNWFWTDARLPVFNSEIKLAI